MSFVIKYFLCITESVYRHHCNLRWTSSGRCTRESQHVKRECGLAAMDHIQNLLLQTGWSCDDLLEKLNEFKKCSPGANVNVVGSEAALNKSEEDGSCSKNVRPIFNCLQVNDSDHNYIKKNYDYPVSVEESEHLKVNEQFVADNKVFHETSVTSLATIINSTSQEETVVSEYSVVSSECSQDLYFESDTKPPQEKNGTNSIINYISLKKKLYKKYVLKKQHLPGQYKINPLFRIKRAHRRRLLHKNIKRAAFIPQDSKRKLEGVRNQILLQLELLRTKKSSDFSKDIKQKIPSDHTVPISCKKRLTNEKVKDDQSETIDCNKICFESVADKDELVVSTNIRNVALEDVVLSTSNQFVISDIRSGTELESGGDTCVNINNNITDNCSSEQLDSYTIKPTKTKDITKIKGWKNKKFVPVACLDITKNVEVALVDQIPGCSYSGNSNVENASDVQNIESSKNNNVINNCDDTQEPSSIVDVSKSAFASNNLDGFLHDSANLHISFQIPKLASGQSSSNTTPPLQPVRAIAAAAVETVPVESIESEVLNDKENLLKIHKITNLYKPRTVAQKRRIWKLKNDTKAKKRRLDNQEEYTRKPRTLAEKRRLLDENEVKRLITYERSGNKRSADKNLNYSYVLYRTKKLKVPTFRESGIIANVKCLQPNKRDYIYLPKKKKDSPNKTKPSIFNTNNALNTDRIRYRPGPLCKKLELQEENKDWTTIIKKLPRIYLEVTPKIGKPIHPDLLHLLPNYDFELTDERIKYAMSVVYDKNSTNSNQTFRFSIPYANQQQSMLFRDKIVKEVNVQSQLENEICVSDTIRNIVSKMLDYVETKEISEDIFRDDVSVIHRNDEVPITSNPRPNSNTNKKPRKSKTNYELKRLNVKVIEVNLEDKEDVVNCGKDYCKMGCVCNSLATTASLVSNHCGMSECMFECNCNYSKKSKGNLKVTLPIGTDLLSEGAVSRLEVEAKKNLARVEKEFTQTVIQACNQTIVVGGHSNRHRRLTKVPRKYHDFIDDPDVIMQAESKLEGNSERKTKFRVQRIEWQPKSCTVNITRLKLDQVVPFCLVHNLHNCHCNYRAPYITAVPEKKIEKVNVSAKVSVPVKVNIPGKVNVPNEVETIFIYAPHTQEFDAEDPTQSFTCARTRGISTSYYLIRNRTFEYVTARKRRLAKLYKEYLESLEEGNDFYTWRDLENNKQNEKSVAAKDDEEEINLPVISKPVNRKDRRKQQLTVREDNIIEPQVKKVYRKKARKPLKNAARKGKYTNVNYQEKMLQKLFPSNSTISNSSALSEEKSASEFSSATSSKSSINEAENTDVIAKSSSTNLKVYKELRRVFELSPKVDTTSKSEVNNVVKDDTLPKFDDLLLASKFTNELLTPSTAVRKKFLQLLGKKNESDAQFRLMPWSGLATRYESNKLQLWYSSFFKMPKIIATDSDVVPRHFTNIKQFENVQDKSLIKVDLIRWLVTKTIPGGKKSDDVLVILQLTKTHCEVCGICEKTSVNAQSSDNMLLSFIPSSVNKVTGSAGTEENKTINFETIDEQKKQHTIAKKIMFSKCMFPGQVLCETNSIDNSLLQDRAAQKPISASLPYINKSSMWRMIPLNSDFSILSLLRNNYAIKYSDLQRVVKMSQTTAATIILKTNEVDENYPHPDFGIYSTPECDENVFIGPYYENENHDISTLRYVNRSLVRTELFNQMKGQSPSSSGSWLRQLHDEHSEKKGVQTIDLTLGESDNETEFIETKNEVYAHPLRPTLQSKLDDSNVTDNIKVDDEVTIINTKTMTEIKLKDKTEVAVDAKIFTSDDVLNFEMSASDFEPLPSNEYLADDNVDGQSFDGQVYFVTNVPMLGYILAHRIKNVTVLRWPTINNSKKFKRIEDAVTWLERELTQNFIVLPNFRIRIKVKTELTPTADEPFDPKYLKGYYIASRYGIKNLLNIHSTTLKILDVTRNELEQHARARAKKILYDKCYEAARLFAPSEALSGTSCSEVIDLIRYEIEVQRKMEEDYLEKQQKLLSRKRQLVSDLSLVIKDISPYVSNKTQTAMLEILKRHKQSAQVDKFSSNKEVVCITIDSDEESSDTTQGGANPETQVQPDSLAPSPPKIMVRKLGDLTEPTLKRKPEALHQKQVALITNSKSVESDGNVRLKKLGVVLNAGDNIIKGPLIPVSILNAKESILLRNIGSPSASKPDDDDVPLTTSTGLTQLKVNESGPTVQHVAIPTNAIFKGSIAVGPPSKLGLKKCRTILPVGIPKYVIQTPSGKLIGVNTDQLKKIQKNHVLLPPGAGKQSGVEQSAGRLMIKNQQSMSDTIVQPAETNVSIVDDISKKHVLLSTLLSQVIAEENTSESALPKQQSACDTAAKPVVSSASATKISAKKIEVTSKLQKLDFVNVLPRQIVLTHESKSKRRSSTL